MYIVLFSFNNYYFTLIYLYLKKLSFITFKYIIRFYYEKTHLLF